MFIISIYLSINFSISNNVSMYLVPLEVLPQQLVLVRVNIVLPPTMIIFSISSSSGGAPSTADASQDEHVPPSNNDSAAAAVAAPDEV